MGWIPGQELVFSWDPQNAKGLWYWELHLALALFCSVISLSTSGGCEIHFLTWNPVMSPSSVICFLIYNINRRHQIIHIAIILNCFHCQRVLLFVVICFLMPNVLCAKGTVAFTKYKSLKLFCFWLPTWVEISPHESVEGLIHGLKHPLMMHLINGTNRGY